MKRVALLLLLAAAAGAQAQQVYRIVGPDGRVTFSDRPAASLADKAAAGTATPVETTAAAVNTAVLPYELRQVALRYPVTLYTSEGCAPCNDGRSLLRSRGVPFIEKTVTTTADSEALTRISGGTTIPFATIGAQAMQGFSSVEWTQYLDLAGYPKQSQMPATYQAPPASPLVTVAAPRPATPAGAAPGASRAAPAAPQRNPAGIEF